MAARARLGRLLLALYPEPWRARYGEELGALLEDDPPGAHGLASLLFGAVDAHLRPQRCWRRTLAAADAMRLSVGALFGCWIAISLAGSTFAKETEHYDAIEHMHPLLSGARDAMTAGAAIGSLAIALGGAPLVWQALVTALRRRDRRLLALLLSPALAAALLVGLAAALAALAPAREHGFPARFVLELLVPVTIAALAVALVCALAPKAVMRHARPPARLLRLAAWSGQVLTGAILLVTGGLLVYVPALWTAPGSVGADPSGPFGASTRAMLCLASAGAVLDCAAALLASGRARRAALA